MKTIIHTLNIMVVLNVLCVKVYLVSLLHHDMTLLRRQLLLLVLSLFSPLGQHQGHVSFDHLAHFLPSFLIDDHVFQAALFPMCFIHVGMDVVHLI